MRLQGSRQRVTRGITGDAHRQILYLGLGVFERRLRRAHVRHRGFGVRCPGVEDAPQEVAPVNLFIERREHRRVQRLGAQRDAFAVFDAVQIRLEAAIEREVRPIDARRFVGVRFASSVQPQ